MNSASVPVKDVAEMEALGTRLAPLLRAGQLIGLRGPLGAGKTTLARGVLHGLGHRDAVKSPTFTLVEPYAFERFTLYHFDLYRLQAAEELEFMGIRDYLNGNGVCLVEWPERGAQVLPQPDLDVMIAPADPGRTVVLSAHSQQGDGILKGLGA